MFLVAINKMRQLCAFHAAFLAMILSVNINADTMLSVKPNKCVAMNKGQLCYQKLRFTFTAPAGDYCLVSESQKTPLRCWQSVQSGQAVVPFQSDSTQQYQLIDGNLEPVASTSVIVAWVYRKSRKRNRWRLF